MSGPLTSFDLGGPEAHPVAYRVERNPHAVGGVGSWDVILLLGNWPSEAAAFAAAAEACDALVEAIEEVSREWSLPPSAFEEQTGQPPPMFRETRPGLRW